jgi:hypothetical protein
MGRGRSYYKDLPSRIQDMALANCEGDDKKLFETGKHSLSAAFNWSTTSEGHDFWENVYAGGEIPAEYLVSEDELYDSIFKSISYVLKH